MGTGIKIVSCYGGMGFEDQIRSLKCGADIIVSTTGRLIDFLNSKLVNLSMVQTLVIDEADRLLEMGFEKQLNEILNLHGNNFFIFLDLPSKESRQTLLFSATFSPLIRSTASQILRDDYLLAATGVYDSEVNKNINQKFYYVEENQKTSLLHSILQEQKSSVIGKFYFNFLVFVDKKKSVDDLHRTLTKANYNCITIHGDKTQFDRNNALEKFKIGKIPLLIGTDVIGRGIDFPNVGTIINYDTPKNLDDYIHRIGRTGRCGNTGVSISFLNENTRPIIPDLYYLLEKNQMEIPDFLYNMFQEGVHMKREKRKGYYPDNKETSKYSETSKTFHNNPNNDFVNKNTLFLPDSNSKMSWRK